MKKRKYFIVFFTGLLSLSAILDAGPVIIALPSNSELIVFKPVKDKYSELAKIKIADSPTYATPVVSGNRIYIKDEKTITLWKIK